MATDDEEYEIIAPDDKRVGRASGFALGIFLGAVVGAAAALLFAPMTGRETRRQLQRRMSHARHRIGEEAEGFRRRVRRRLERH
jgi:gas vesicle protein